MRCACATPPVPEEGPAGEVLTPFDEVLRHLARRDINDTPFCKDISRLCRRLVIRNSRIPEEKSWEASEASTVDVIADILLYVMGELEPEYCERVRRRMLEVAAEQRECKDMEGVVSLLVDAVGGERSASVRILKLINQGVILAAVEHLHYTVCKDLMTKDVRGKDGWRVVLDLDESRVQLHHIRREQSMDAFGDAKDHFEFEYEVTCTFELSTASLVTGSLRIIRLDTAESMSEERRSQLRARLLGDVIVG